MESYDCERKYSTICSYVVPLYVHHQTIISMPAARAWQAICNASPYTCTRVAAHSPFAQNHKCDVKLAACSLDQHPHTQTHS